MNEDDDEFFCDSTTAGIFTKRIALLNKRTALLKDKLAIAISALEKIKSSSCCNVCECLACDAKEALDRINKTKEGE